MRISTALLIFPTAFLCLLQLFVTILSVISLPFPLALLFGTSGALLLAYMITLEFSEVVSVTKFQLTALISLSTLTTFILSLRLNAEIFDFTCPTGLLGLTNQVASGHFPVSYLSFPEITMNYHQGFILLSGILTEIIEIPAALAIKGLLLLFIFLLQIGIGLLFLKYNNPYFFLPSILTLTIASFGSDMYKHITSPSSYIPVSMLDASMSNSWPLSLLLIITLLFTAAHYQHSVRHIIYVGILILSLSTINGLLFQLAIGFLVVFYMLFLTQYWRQEKKLFTDNADIVFALFLIIVLLPRFLPSVFLVGAHYTSPEVSFAIFERSVPWYLTQSKNYLILVGLLPLYTLLVAGWAFLKNKLIPLTRLLTLTLLLVYIIPLLFTFKGFLLWEALHKFAYISMFLSILLLTFLFQQLTQYRVMLWIGVVCAIISSQHTAFSGYSLDYLSFSNPPEGMTDVISYLDQHETFLIPFKTHSYIGMPIGVSGRASLCEMFDTYSLVAQYSGNFIRAQHYNGFLLNPELESRTQSSASWDDFEKKALEVKGELDTGATLIAEKSRFKSGERERLEILLEPQVTEFSEYVLYRTKPWDY